jgi:hypothetical protein
MPNPTLLAKKPGLPKVAALPMHLFPKPPNQPNRVNQGKDNPGKVPQVKEHQARSNQVSKKLDKVHR